MILHVDMDTFYVSVELRHRPDLQDAAIPVWVGGDRRGVVLSANHEARRRGVSGGMSSTRARRLCPEAVALTPQFDRYAQASDGIFEIFATITPHVEQVSVDEAFLDVGAARWPDPVALAEHIRAMVADEQQLPCSVGIGPTKLVAKVASRRAKPDGILAVAAPDVTTFLHSLPASELWGVGEATARQLQRHGLVTVADVAHTSRRTLQRMLGPVQGAHLADMAWGIDTRRVVPTVVESSVSSGETLGRDCDDPHIIATELVRLSHRTAARLRRRRVCARGLTLSLRFADQTSLSRSRQLTSPTDSYPQVRDAVIRLWEQLHLQRARVRGLQVSARHLIRVDEVAWQPRLDEPERGWREAERAADAAITRFGDMAVRPASLTRRAAVHRAETDSFQE